MHVVGNDLDYEYDENEPTCINLENIVESCRKLDYAEVPLEHLLKVHRFFLNTHARSKNLNLVDLTPSNGSFTCINRISRPNHVSYRLEKFLVSDSLLMSWEAIESIILPLTRSNH